MLSVDDVEDGSSEKAYMAARSMKGLWRARSHDLDSWRRTIEWMTPPGALPAWKKLPSESNPFNTAKAFFEAEVHPDYDKLLAYVEIMLGIEWAKRIADNYADKPGPQTGTANNPNHDEQGRFAKSDDHNSHAHNYYGKGEKQRGTSKAYLLERLSLEVVAEIGKGKRYKSVHEAARKTGVIDVPDRYYVPSDPQAAGRYLAERVDREWFDTLIDTYYKAIDK